MKEQLLTAQSYLQMENRGIINTFIIQFIKESWERAEIGGFAVSIAVLSGGSYYIFEAGIAATDPAFGPSGAGGLAVVLVAVYVGWVAFVAYEEITERELSRTIKERPSITTLDDAFGLLQSKDEIARANASCCLNAVISTSTRNVINTTDVPPDEIVGYLTPYLQPENENENEEISQNIAGAISFLARDYPESVEGFKQDIIEAMNDESLPAETRGNLARSVGFLLLERDPDLELKENALELSEDSSPNVRIGACYILASISDTETRERLNEIARNDPNEEVRVHAEELTQPR